MMAAVMAAVGCRHDGSRDLWACVRLSLQATMLGAEDARPGLAAWCQEDLSIVSSRPAAPDGRPFLRRCLVYLLQQAASPGSGGGRADKEKTMLMRGLGEMVSEGHLHRSHLTNRHCLPHERLVYCSLPACPSATKRNRFIELIWNWDFVSLVWNLLPDP